MFVTFFEYFGELFSRPPDEKAIEPKSLEHKRCAIYYVFDLLFHNCYNLCYAPSFILILFYTGIVGEMYEALGMINQKHGDLILGILKVWCKETSLVEYPYFMRWMMLILEKAMNYVSDGDRKKISAMACNHKFAYASSLMNYGNYRAALTVLGEISQLPTIELSQNLNKFLREADCC